MKISVNEEGFILLEEVYNPVVIKSKSGAKISVCERDEKLEVKNCRENLNIEG
jgi:hypothetical protein